jgi:hypothetical protein
MIFASPLWLIVLAPWGALVVWALSGRLEKTGIPFLNLWHAPAPPWQRPRRGWRVPPVVVTALLAAMLLAILAAAGPIVPESQYPAAVTIVVDRGIYSPFAKSAAEALDVLKQSFPDANVSLHIVPQEDSLAGGDWFQRIGSLAPTAADDGDALTLACRQALRETAGPVLLLSNRSVGFADGRLVQITSSDAITNVGIDLLSVRSEAAASQAMIKLLNQSALTSARLTVRADEKTVQSRQISLPATGSKGNYFVDIPDRPSVVEAEVDCDDSIKINHRAWTVRSAVWPIIEAGSALPPELTRLIRIYSRRRPASESSRRIVVTADPEAIPAGVPVAILPDATAQGKMLSAPGSLIVRSAPVDIRSVDWARDLVGATVFPSPHGDWQPVVSAGDSILLALRDSPVRQVWIGFRSDDFARRADFVVFWSEIFNWLGGGDADYVSQRVGASAGHWTPGLYRSGAGVLDAVNATAPPIPAPPPVDWRGKLRSLAAASEARVPISSIALAAATVLAALALIAWPASKPGGRKTVKS